MDNEKFQELMLQQFQNITGELKNLNRQVANMEEGQSRLASVVDKLEVRLGTVEKGQLKLETKLENEVADKIRALFDDREVQNDKLARMEDKLERVANDTAYLVSEAARLKRAAK